ncbi:MAG: CHASE3 domain-containing protein, partial [Phycisphaerae bacterium]
MKRTALLLWFVAVAVLLAANSVVCYVNVRKLIDHSAYVSRSRETIFALDRLMSALKDAETSERGYVITQDPTYLEPYRESIAAIKTESRALDDLVPADAPQQMQVTALRALADEKLEILLKVVEIRDRQGFDAAKSAIQYGIDGRPGAPLRNGKRVMDDARTVSENLRQTEKRELDARQAERDTASTTATATLIGAGGLNVFLLIGLGVAVYRHVSARAAATAERERSARLAAEVDERHRVARTLEALNQKLETSNRELQDFAHVASHDLQEPLRKIQAFGDRLQKRFAGVLADDGRDYVDR